MILLGLVFPSLLALLQHKVGIKMKFCALDSEGFLSLTQLQISEPAAGLGSCRDLLLTWNSGEGPSVSPEQSNPLWAGTCGWMWGCSHSVLHHHIQGQPQSSGGVSINCVMPSELTLDHKPGFLIESFRLIRVLGVETWGMCAGAHPPNKGTAVGLEGLHLQL